MSLIYLDTIPLDVGFGDDPYQTNYSYWYAVHNPMIFGFVRKDFTVAAVADDGAGNAKVTFSSPDAVKMALVAVGQAVYINAHNMGSSVTYIGLFTVIDTDFSTYITLGTPFLGDAAEASYLNANDALVGYYVDVEITREGNVVLQKARYVPLFDGTLSIDAAGYLRRLAAITDKHDYDPGTIILRDYHLAGSFVLRYRERFNEESTTPGYEATTISAPETGVWWVNAAKQIGNTYGSNMAEYVPFPQSIYWQAEFLTLFDELYYWRGYPFEVGFIISSQALFEYFGHLVIDIQTHPTFSEIAKSVDPQVAGVYRTNISDDDTEYAGAIAEYITLQIITDGTPQDDELTVQKKIWVKQCAQNSIYIKWINTVGGWSYWMFEFDQTKAVAVSEAKTFQQTIYDLATADSGLQYLSKRAFPKMTIGADGITAQIMKGLKGILYSPKVMWMTNPEDWQYKFPPKWQTVLVDPGSFTLESTRVGFANVEMVIEFPEIQIQSQ